MNTMCLACRKMLYRTDACKGDGSVPCGRTDGGSKKSEGRQLSVSTPAAKGIDRRDSARSVRPTSDTSTAARKDVRTTMEEAGSDQQHAVGGNSGRYATVAPSTSGSSVSALAATDVATVPVKADTQALPVDTTPKRVGRPQKHPDRKAYRAAWLRKDRRDHPEKYGKPAKGKT